MGRYALCIKNDENNEWVIKKYVFLDIWGRLIIAVAKRKDSWKMNCVPKLVSVYLLFHLICIVFVHLCLCVWVGLHRERRGSVFLSIHARFPLSYKANRCISVYFCLCNCVFVFVYLCLCIRVEPCRETRQCIFAHSCWAPAEQQGWRVPLRQLETSDINLSLEHQHLSWNCILPLWY